MQPPPLDYQPPPRRQTTQIRRRDYESQEETSQRHRRTVFWVALSLIVGIPEFYVAKNVLMFGKLTPLRVSDFDNLANNECLPTVRAIKQYRHDTGHWPADIQKQLVPNYLPAVPWAQDFQQNSLGVRFVCLDALKYNETIVYNFDPTNEGWSLEGKPLSGPMSLPVVPMK